MKCLGLVVVFAVFYQLQSATCIPCEVLYNSNNYTAFEKVLLTDENLVKLQNAFFPTNAHSSVVVNVNYYLYKVTTTKPDYAAQWMSTGAHNVIKKEAIDKHCSHPSIRNGREVIYCHKFRWLFSPINLFTRPDLLKRLSLMTYRANSTDIDLFLEAPCSSEELPLRTNDVSPCKNLTSLVIQLNVITSNVS